MKDCFTVQVVEHNGHRRTKDVFFVASPSEPEAVAWALKRVEGLRGPAEREAEVIGRSSVPPTSDESQR